MSLLHGVIPILPTPFKADGEVDAASLRRVAEWAIDRGVHGLGTLALASEGYKLTEEERSRVLGAVVEAAQGRVPVVAGVYHEATRVAEKFGADAAAHGAAALMIFPPVLGKLSSQQLVEHLAAIACSVSVPVIVQDTPQLRGSALTLADYARILEAAPNVKYAKIEAVPAGQAIQAVLESLGDRMEILAGWGGLEFMDALRRGACGCMPGADVAPLLVEVYQDFRAGDLQRAQSCFDRLLPLLAFSSVSLDRFVVEAKTVLHRAGLIANPAVRPPCQPLDRGERAELDRLLHLAGIA